MEYQREITFVKFMILYFHKGITNYMFHCKNKPSNNHPCPILLKGLCEVKTLLVIFLFM